jgi:hypothetical protein
MNSRQCCCILAATTSPKTGKPPMEWLPISPFKDNTMSLMKLSALLDRVTTLEPEYNGGLSNHLPMALVALQRLGASDTRLDEYYAFYAPRLSVVDMKQEENLPDFQWTEAVGEMDGFWSVRGYFLKWLANQGRENVLREVLPALFKGVGAAAFHGLIRTAYALEAQHDNELATALAYWTCRFLSLVESKPRSGGMQFHEWVTPFLSLSAPDGKFGLIFEEMRAAASSKRFIQALNGLSVDEKTLSCLSQYACRLYLRQKNFTVLHLITGTHAARTLMPWISDREEAIRYFAVAYAAGLVAAGVTNNVLSPPSVEIMGWDEITARSISSQDDHVIKLVYSCMQEARYYDSSVYQAVASSVVAI